MLDKKSRKISPTTTILVVFLAIIAVGTILLMLPVSSRLGKPTDFLSAVFSATSATCITGLTVADTLSYWSGFGQVVILALVQCGGLGFMVFAALFSLAVRRRISLRERLIMTQLFSVDEMSGIVRLAKRVLVWTAVFEGAGALILSVRFIPDFGVADGIFKSIFHSVSAFCNAGFDIMGAGSGSVGSISRYATDPLVCLTLIGLMIIGGIGFLVWEDICAERRFRRFSLHTKLVLVTTVILLVTGTAMFLLFEYSNGKTIGNLSFGEKLLASFFESSTTRSAGFVSFSQADMTVQSKFLSAFLMFIGGSPGSAAGGIKTATLAVLVITSWSVLWGKSDVTAFGRRIPSKTVFRAIAISTTAILLSAISAIIIVQTNDVSAESAIFEALSAFSTSGMSMGITPWLNPVSKIILIFLMYFGRVGLLTLSIGLLISDKQSKLRYPEGKIIIG